MEGLSAKMGGLELEAEAEVQDYGLPKDHPFTQPGDRIPIPMKLKSADDYKSAGGQLVAAPEDCYRTCASDPDPVVATFDGVISPEECAAVIALAQPKMSRAGVTTDDGRGGRQADKPAALKAQCAYPSRSSTVTLSAMASWDSLRR